MLIFENYTHLCCYMTCGMYTYRHWYKTCTSHGFYVWFLWHFFMLQFHVYVCLWHTFLCDLNINCLLYNSHRSDGHSAKNAKVFYENGKKNITYCCETSSDRCFLISQNVAQRSSFIDIFSWFNAACGQFVIYFTPISICGVSVFYVVVAYFFISLHRNVVTLLNNVTR
jgi:hypothetical protein